MPVTLRQQIPFKLILCLLLALCSLLSFQLFAADLPSAPIALEGGIAGETLEQLPATSEGKAFKPLSGRKVYKRFCIECHTMDVWGLGAPKLGNVKAWAPRISKGREALYLSAFYGFKKMPRRGFCHFCTDGELKAAVDYMVKKAQPKKTRNYSATTNPNR